ncbi:hypothetical protein [Candidatus Kuenenia stuttgartiensis]|uniref:TubC N-terminal docking domain-containing protein n=1 Tax=Kuenenia stuttgartiensis TaxID=174633 RepID=A0A2C9CAL9_KUEST|nr:hypothetical protein [Candidatus Kuenenia stuttgartiensis]SOH02804.1 hypothetical protein KSMBR1_0288 [Candidatus Kuenenia stuttgartiensis]
MINETLLELEKAGYRVTLNGDKICLDFVGKEKPAMDTVLPLLEALKQNKAEAIVCLQQAEALNERMAIMGENCSPDEVLPYVTEFNSLVIPFASPARYHWWKGGQSPCETLKELGRCDLLDKYRHVSGN